MARGNYRCKRISDTEVDLICDSCNHAVRASRDAFKEWLSFKVSPAGNPFRNNCPSCGAEDIDWTPNPSRISALDNEFVRFGTTVKQVVAHRANAKHTELEANISFILLDKEERRGLKSFSQPERFVINECTKGSWLVFLLACLAVVTFHGIWWLTRFKLSAPFWLIPLWSMPWLQLGRPPHHGRHVVT